MTARLNLVLLALLLIVGLPFYLYFIDNPSRRLPPQPLSLADVRNLAASLPGERPGQVKYVLVGTKGISGNLLAAGSGIKPIPFSINSFILTGGHGGPVVIDSGVSRAQAAQLELDQYFAEHQREIDAALGQARLILATSEKTEALGGLAAFAARQSAEMALARARLNTAQVPRADDSSGTGVDWPPSLVLRPAITSDAPMAVAPGIVVIPLGVPSLGSQMVYVRLADDREYVLTGDLAPYAQNFRELRTHSAWLDRDLPADKRSTAMRWLRTLRAWQRDAPGLILLPGHDHVWVTDPPNRTMVR